MSDAAWRTVVDPFKKQTFTFLETADETGGARLVTLIEVQPGGGPPPHSHSMVETFELVDGDIEVLAQGERRLLQPGSPVTVLGGAIHTFTNPNSIPATVKVTVEQPGDFERVVRVLAGLARDGILADDQRPPVALLAALKRLGGDYYEPVMPRLAWNILNGALAPFGRKAADAALARYARPTQEAR